MTISYVDTSAAMKLARDERKSEALYAEIATGRSRSLVSSWLLHTELHCAAGRHPEWIPLPVVDGVLRSVGLVELTRSDLLAAGTHAPLRSLDAIHLAVALRIGADEIITYDDELADAARSAGIAVVAPL